MSPLQLTSTNATAANVLAIGLGSVAVSMGQLAVDWTAQAEASATLSFNKTCPGGGTLSATLADRDGDRRAGAGDQLSVTATGCYLKELDDTMDGAVTVALPAPAGSQQRAGIVTFNGFRTSTANPAQEMQGALRFDYSTSRLSKLLHVASDTNSFDVRFIDNAKAFTETLTALDVQHETRIDTVRATTGMRFHLASELLGGSLDVTTAKPWSAWFDSYPDAGETTLAGANGGTTVLRAAATPSTSAEVVFKGAVIDGLDLDGIGVLWTGAPWLPKVASADKYMIKWQSPTSLEMLLEPDAKAFLPNGSLVWLYSRPIDPASIVQATFLQASAQPGGPANVMFTPVPAKIGIEGGLLTLTPSTQLLPGASYQLQLLSYAGSGIAATTGGRIAVPQFSGAVMQTISANIAMGGSALLLGPSATLALDASASSANGAAPASYRWKQLSGPALNFSDANAVRVTVTPASTSNGKAVVELTVANAAGDVDRRTVDVSVAADIAQALILSYQVSGAPADITTNFDAIAGTAYAHLVNANTTLDIILGFKRILLGRSGGQTWQTGLTLPYDNGIGNASGVGGVVSMGCGDNKNTGTVTILDLALDGAGNLDRLALDFDDICQGTLARGSVRYRSTLPLR